MIRKVVSSFWILVIALMSASGAGHSEVAQVTSLLNRYYALDRQGEKDQAVDILLSIIQIDPDSSEAWRALGYQYQSMGLQADAAEAFGIAARGDGRQTPDPQMLLASGYAYQSAGLDNRAVEQFRGVTRYAQSSAVYSDGCRGRIFTAPLIRSRMPDPWGLSFYSDTVSLSQSNNTVTENRLRLYRYLDEMQTVSIYGKMAYQDDRRSGIRNEVLESFNDNFKSLALGFDWKILPSLTAYAEVNRYDNKFPATGFGSNETGIRAGIIGFQAWGAPPDCRLTAQLPLLSFGQAYGSIEYIERYDNIQSQANIIQGLRLFEYRMSSLSAYAKANVLKDSKGLFYNNLAEAGLGLSWRPSLDWPIEVRVERLFGQYLNGSDFEENDFQNTRVQFLVNFDL